MKELVGNVLVTGGTGTLGHAIAARATQEEWPCTLTIVSRDPLKQQHMRRLYPKCRYVLADITDAAQLEGIMAGHDLVIHAAAQKHIPEGERQPSQCYAVNVRGSMNVIAAAERQGVRKIIGISTDKACWPVNAYGCTKLMMERAYQEFAKRETIAVNLVRYGNVLGSNGSVLQVWRETLSAGGTPKITDPSMTRFWLSENQAVDLILYALTEPSGTITIPRLPALSMARLAEYVLPDGVIPVTTGLRPGEKMHEMLITPQEGAFIGFTRETYYIRARPVTDTRGETSAYPNGYTSDIAPEMTRAELLALTGGALC